MMGKRTMWACAGLLIVGVLAVPALAGQRPHPWQTIDRQAANSSTPAFRTAVVENNAQWQQWLASADRASSPFARLDPAQQAAFSRSLVFRDGVLAAYDHEVLLHAFAAADAYQLLAVFGLEHELAFLPGVRVASLDDQRAMAEARRGLVARRNPFARTVVRTGLAPGEFQPARRVQPD